MVKFGRNDHSGLGKQGTVGGTNEEMITQLTTLCSSPAENQQNKLQQVWVQPVINKLSSLSTRKVFFFFWER